MMTREPCVRYADGISKEALLKLWVDCFPEDEDGFAAWYINTYFRPEQACAIVSEDGLTLESALYWLPCTYESHREGSGCKGRMVYIYAMGTAAAYRRRGNLRAMLNFTEAHCRRKGISAMLLHAMDTSRSSVEAFGMKPLLELRQRKRLIPGTPVPPEWCEGTFEDFSRLRKNYIKNLSGAIYWEERELQFVYEDLCRDGALRFFWEEEQLHYAVIKSYGEGGLLVEESDNEKLLLKPLPGNITVLSPGRGSYAAHIKLLSDQIEETELSDAYFNLMLR